MLNREPALIIGLVNALVALAVGFAVAAVLAFVTRRQVSPA